jgi:hypothetical protein
MTMYTLNIKDEAKRLPNTFTWDDLMHEIYIRQAIEAGLTDSKAGRTTDIDQVRSEFGLSK